MLVGYTALRRTFQKPLLAFTPCNRRATSSLLVTKKCIPCEGGIKPLATPEIQTLSKQLHGEWTVADKDKKIRRDFKLKNFVSIMSFVNKIAAVAEQEQHHPDLHITNYSNLAVELWTHSISGLSENDFILAARIDAIWDKELKIEG